MPQESIAMRKQLEESDGIDELERKIYINPKGKYQMYFRRDRKRKQTRQHRQRLKRELYGLLYRP